MEIEKLSDTSKELKDYIIENFDIKKELTNCKGIKGEGCHGNYGDATYLKSIMKRPSALN